uniref:trichohyalin-like isoform X3 n=1 Tax=Fragaria vesca subsp. vesca TaxID=101020 RepID=UPI0005C96289|nr:PREDICTED: trichohyalin-like isoform X3 [Fragaria vesca subsp. vesca]
MAPGPPPASDPGTQLEADGNNPTIPELISPLRDSFHAADFDRAEQALILREANLKKQNQILQETAELERLETLRLADELNALKKRPPPPQKEVSDEDRKVISKLRREKSRLEMEKLFLKRECEGLESRISVLEDDVGEKVVGSSLREDHRHNGSAVNLENVFESLISVQNLQVSGKTKLDKVIEKQKVEYAKLEKMHKFEMQKMLKVENEYAALNSKHQLQQKEKVKVENELKDCRVEIQKLKEELSVIEKKHRNEYEDVEQKHQSNSLEMLKIQNEVTLLKEERRLLEGKHKSEYKALEQKHQYDLLEMLKVENELKVCKDALVELKQEQKLLEEKHKNDYKALEQKYQSHLLEVENELKHCKAELKGLKEEKNISNEKYEKLLEEVNEHRKDEDELGNFESQKNKEDAISRVRKIMNAKLLALQNMAKISKNNGVTDGSRNQNCIEIPKHVIDVEDLCDSVPPNVSPRRNAVGNSGTSKSSYVEAILLSDSDDDCAPEEPESFGLKRKRTSSLNASDNNYCGHHLEEESFPTAENKLRRMLGRCGFVVSDYRRQNNPSSCDHEISKQRSSIESPAKVNGESDSSSASIFSSDDSDDDGDINLVSTLMSITNRP